MTADFVIVGSGINSLVCGALLARAGRAVIILERNDRAGGCIRSEELFPGYVHDILSSWYPLFVASPAYQELGPDLHARGLEVAETSTPTGVLTEDGRVLVLSTDDDANVARLNALEPGEGDRYARAMEEFLTENADLAFGLLNGELWRRSTAGLMWREARRRGGIGELAAFFGEALEPCRAWLERDFRNDLTKALVAPWVLHAGLGPDDAYSGVMGKIIVAALVMAGMPVVKGGSANVVSAFERLIADHDGDIVTGIDAERVLVRDGRAVGVRDTNGAEYGAERAVICNVTPTQLYSRLLADTDVPGAISRRAAAYRYGRADMQIHFALSEPPDWTAPELRDVALLHLTPGLDGVSKAVNEAERGLLPERATVVVGQPTAVDPSRAPEGGWILWIQLQELPARVGGDAAGELDAPEDGQWVPALREAYADRIQARLQTHIRNLDEAIVGRRAFSPSDLEDLNVNLVGGDPYSGACTLDQFLLWRPFGGVKDHRTPIRDLYHIGASTHPGPGLGGNSGFMVARRLM